MENKNAIDLLIVIGSLGAMMWGMLRFMLKDIHNDLDQIKKNSDRHEKKMDQYEKRIDHLYHVSVELLKRRNRR